MSIFSKLLGLINEKTQIQHRNITSILTKHGMFRIKMYKHNHQDYLAIMSQNFFDVEAPIFYIHSDKHECNSLDEFCGCSYPISVALNMINKDGGLILYSSRDTRDIDALLQEVNTKKLQSQGEIMRATNLSSALKGYKGEYLTIDFILKDLKLSTIQLVSDNPNIMFIMQQRGVQVINQTPTISFSYGENKPYGVNEAIEAEKAIPFEYNNSNQSSTLK